MARRSELGISTFEFVAEALLSPITYELGDLLPVSDVPSRPREWPGWVYLLIIDLAKISPGGSVSSAVTEIASPLLWKYICDTTRSMFPDDPSRWADVRKATPPSRGAVTAKEKYLKSPEFLEGKRQLLRRHAIADARKYGLIGGGVKGSLTHPRPENVITGDVTTVKPMFRSRDGKAVDRRTGEVRQVRFDPEAVKHHHGDGEAWGHPFEVISASSEEAGGNRILDIAPLIGGQEAEGFLAAEMAIGIAEESPGVQAFASDSVLRGVHANLLQRFGLIPLHRQFEDFVGTDEETGEEIKAPREYAMGTATFTSADGTERTFAIQSVGGHACINLPDEEGNPCYIPLERIATLLRGRKPGSMYFYNDYLAAEELGGGVARIRMTRRLTDSQNLEEHMHIISPWDDDFARLFARRPGAESVNSWLKRWWVNKRARFFGRAGAMLTLLSDWYVNILTCNIKARRRRAGLDPLPTG